jgi:beta-phosphoglucomutase-like phosphatase (HAD superfamily)
MTPSASLDAAIRQARYLLFAFDGLIRSTDMAKNADSTTPTTRTSAYLHDTLAACRESGRLAAVISADPSAEVCAYLDAHDLLALVAVVAESIDEATTTLVASPGDCLLITSAPADIEAAQAAGTSSVGYARTPDDAARLADARASAVVYSLADIALKLRARTFD